MCETVTVCACLYANWPGLVVRVSRSDYLWLCKSVILLSSEISCSLIFAVGCGIVRGSYETVEFVGLWQFMMLIEIQLKT